MGGSDTGTSSGREVYPNKKKASCEFHCEKSHKRKASVLLELEQGSGLDNLLMGVFFMVMIVFTIVILLGDHFFLPDDTLEWCRAAQLGQQWVTYKNADAIRDPCYYERTPYLLGWSIFECDFGRRMLTSVVLGAAIGYERKAADRPAGIRTMSLVCLGAATFTMGGQFAFRSSTMGWDAARVSAAIPSGVGFLGSALIWKETTGQGQNQRNQVHGITTAASVWLSASVGIGVGGALYVMSVYAVVLVVFVLRIGPRLLEDSPGSSASQATGDESDLDIDKDDDSDDDDDDDDDEVDKAIRLSLSKLEAQQQQHQDQQQSTSTPPRSPRKGIPKQVSYKKRMSQIRRESMRIQKQQQPTLKSD